MNNQRPCLLMILDGWGVGLEDEKNAIHLANTPNLDRFQNEYPYTQLICSGESVGLPSGIMGNSEVGYLNIGAGRVVYQDLLRIDKSIREGTFFNNSVLGSVMSKVKASNSALHLMGLVSDGGVHSQLTYLFALLEMVKTNKLNRVFVHVILDGRDTPPDSGVRYTRQLEEHINRLKCGNIASICGRFYAMDRDMRWERTEKAYRLYTLGKGILEKEPVEAIKNAYGRGETDEFVIPVAITGTNQKPIGLIRDRDGVILFNFRADRTRQITQAFTQSDFSQFKRDPHPQLCDYVCMTLFDKNFSLPVAFPPFHLKDILGEVISRKHFRLREGILGDIAPTILEILGIDPPHAMTGKSLIVRN